MSLCPHWPLDASGALWHIPQLAHFLDIFDADDPEAEAIFLAAGSPALLGFGLTATDAAGSGSEASSEAVWVKSSTA